ncbi:DNA endonuclease SmrA [Shewanella maritima]|uniref:DNA endonuclease SmrA n=1 Tax=Shewanella maritima TaxID=2520507 RepID=UPI0037370813
MIDDSSLFYAEMADVAPLKQQSTTGNVIAQHQFKSCESHLARQNAAATNEQIMSLCVESRLIHPVKPDEYVEFHIQGVQHAVFKQLRQGQYECKSICDLTGLSLIQARDFLYKHLCQSHQLGHRTLLIIHGKGHHNKPYPAILKSAVAQWLTQIDVVQAYSSATKDKGGTGAMFVMLSKSHRARIETSEQNRKGSGRR